MSRYSDMQLIKMEIERRGAPKVEGYASEDTRSHLVSPNELVIPDEEIAVEFRYPLSAPVRFSYSQKGGFTRLDVYRLIYEGYKRIYEEEDQEVGDPGLGSMSYNRRTSKGKYGIWGHYLSDLWLEFVYYNPKEKIVYLQIGS